MANATTPERLTALETWREGHDDICTERYDSLKGDVRWILRGVIGILLGLTAWLAMQLVDRLEHPPAAAPFVQTTPRP